MTQKERERLKVIHRREQNDLTVALAAESLHLSERQLYRILKRYRQQGDAGLMHRLRGQASHHAHSAAAKTKALRLYREQYSDYGPTLFAEQLENDHALVIAPETLRRWLSADGQWHGARKKRPHRRRRQRRPAIGSLVQLDGSPHDWFEGRGPYSTLLVAIDDASNRVFLRFVESENTREVLLAVRLYFERYGIPLAFYIPTIRDSVFYGDNKPTDYQRAMQNLGVQTIFAHSPQSRRFGTRRAQQSHPSRPPHQSAPPPQNRQHPHRQSLFRNCLHR